MEANRRDLLEEVGQLLRQISLRSRAHVHETLADMDMPGPVSWALRELAEPMAMRDLAERMWCDASYITAIADRLEKEGWAVRGSDPDDRRVKQLVLTEGGRRARAEMIDRIHADMPIARNLTTQELEQLVGLLRKSLLSDH
ncbi:MAG: MarR family transcriptional regulator [Acidimicrobiia bacterium]